MPELLMFCSGLLIMVLEMVGARVLAPHVGTSTVVWTSLIGVVLACLALGGYVGGRLADRWLSRRVLGHVLTLAGVSCAVTASCHQLIGSRTMAIDNLYLAALAAAVGVFALPGLCCGMLGPYIIRLRLARLETAGATVGRLYALSTAGSIAGTFLGGFVLISWLPSSVILWGVTLSMLLLALLASPLRPWGATLLRAGLFLLCLLLMAAGAGRADRAPWLLLESSCNSIRLWDTHDGARPVRLMATDPGFSQSGMYLDDPQELYFPYTRYFALGTWLVPGARRVLMLGGGGYSVPKWLLAGRSGLEADGLECTVVELDPAMTRVARDYFALDTDDARLRVVHADARAFLERQGERYDLIFVDVFNSCYAVPFHLGTQEAAAALRRAVAPDGAVLMNVIGAAEGRDARLFQGIYAALAGQFAEVHVFGVGQPYRPDSLQNLMLLALPQPRGDWWHASAQDMRPELAFMLGARLSVSSGGTPPLRDDFAPVERYVLPLLAAQRAVR